MRTFYIFKIKKDYVNLYSNNPSTLYSIINHLYSMKKRDISFGINLFSQLTNSINKSELDRKIFIKYHQDILYSKNGNDHVINNLYKDEVSILTIKHSYILITTNKNYSTFFNIINSFGSEYFVCDFINSDYFWINDIKILV